MLQCSPFFIADISHVGYFKIHFGNFQAVQLTFHILNFSYLYIFPNCEEKAVYLIVGYMNYLEGEHVRYAVVAVIALIFMIILPPLLFQETCCTNSCLSFLAFVCK